MKPLQELVAANTIKPMMVKVGELEARATVCISPSPVPIYGWIILGPLTHWSDFTGSEADVEKLLRKYA